MARRGAAAAVAAGGLVVLLGGVGVLALRSSDTSTTYDEATAVEAFRSASSAPVPSPSPTSSAVPTAPSASSPAPAGAPSPVAAPAPPAVRPSANRPPASAASADPEVQPGVYRYDTQGYEEVDAFGGARHDYPGSTTVTYSRKGCGTEERWQPLEERVGITLTCRGPRGGEVRETYQQRAFFGQSEGKAYRCDPGVLVLPREPRAGQRWTAACTSDDSTATFDVRVVGLEQLEVEGQDVPVVRVRLDGTLTGSTRGTSDREVWLSRERGLLVQATGDTDTDADTAGGTIRYRESYRLRLLSLTPRR